MLADLRRLEREPLPPKAPGLSRVAWTARRKAAAVAVSVAVVLAFFLLVFPAVVRQIRRAPTPSILPQQKHLAVLPFVVLDARPATAAFANDLTATLTAGLPQLVERYSLQVTPASEVRGKDVSTAEEALKEFGASLVLETSVEQSKGSIRVAYLLIDTATRRQLRGDTITAPAARRAELNEEAANRVLAGLEAELAARRKTGVLAGADKTWEERYGHPRTG